MTKKENKKEDDFDLLKDEYFLNYFLTNLIDQLKDEKTKWNLLNK